ncbi:uncharacterized protein DUF397 [Murinocardiopsis flavida]|uniref:Uncharacterized protein DUF397 n=1 Tax=Murinocardiopsis flavida TaxID=645275 RepID=A0A2P8DJS0_9ACTN|nr:DUF397 domain-containing protein [Murinocardiopsis flavida]PSK97439.1 uncharacterized protein DUF397 [Murinocardiopsis flavida]
MTAFDDKDPVWRTSSYSGTGGGQCVEVASCRTATAVRDSKRHGAETLIFSAPAWAAFVEAVARGEL